MDSTKSSALGRKPSAYAPAEFLSALRSVLEIGGRQICGSHLSPETLSEVSSRTGTEAGSLSPDIVHHLASCPDCSRELVFLAMGDDWDPEILHAAADGDKVQIVSAESKDGLYRLTLSPTTEKGMDLLKLELSAARDHPELNGAGVAVVDANGSVVTTGVLVDGFMTRRVSEVWRSSTPFYVHPFFLPEND